MDQEDNDKNTEIEQSPEVVEPDSMPVDNELNQENTKNEVESKIQGKSQDKKEGDNAAGDDSGEPVSKSHKMDDEVIQKSEPVTPFPSAMPPSSVNKSESFYHIKWIMFNGRKTAIVTQNENGPCPLLAIFNVLLLHRRVELPEALTVISSTKMMDHIGEVVWSLIPQNISEEEKSNYEQNISDAVVIFPKLQTGLDVNVKFTSVDSFECTPELAVFDLLRIPLYHGWVVDPQDAETSMAIGSLSYNQIVEKIINSNSSNLASEQHEGFLANEFLMNNASQLTWHGILELSKTVKSGNLAVLFRNNHFSTLYMEKDELYTLVTDFGFLREPSVVWETMSSVQGDSHFVDNNFHKSPLKTDGESIETCPSNHGTAEQIDYDYQVALSLQQDQVPGSSCGQETETTTTQNTTAMDEDASYQLALQLQREEEEQALAAHPHATQSSQQPATDAQGTRSHRSASTSPSHKEGCSLL